MGKMGGEARVVVIGRKQYKNRIGREHVCTVLYLLQTTTYESEGETRQAPAVATTHGLLVTTLLTICLGGLQREQQRIASKYF